MNKPNPETVPCYICFKAMTDDDPTITVKATEAEWRDLIAPAKVEKLPVDGSTVDGALSDMLMNRPNLHGHTLEQGVKVHKVVMP